jgi:lipopolysaccharide export LptBFGC system permease protein LptF
MLAMPLQEYVIPALADKLARGKSQIGADTINTFDVKLAVDGRGNLFTARQFDPKTQTMTNLTILERDAQTGLVTRTITAAGAQWNRGQSVWRLTGGVATVRVAGGEARARAGQAVAAYGTDLSPKLLLARRATIYPRLLSLTELRDMAANPAADQALLTQIMQGRFSLMVVNILILVMALPFFLLREPANRMVQAVKAAGLVLGAWGLALVVMQVSTGHLGNPYTAAWLPVVIYLPVSAWLLQTIKT